MKPGENVPGTRRSREDILRDIKLALAIDGLGLDERRRTARGFDPYDSAPGRNGSDPWKGRRRG
ncbi:MAG TPA: hypothetical protein VHY19_14645 [Steroidobacteraceae bacterium]|nr:hypothetical protein [Steroidobacteraceae bacterium]